MRIRSITLALLAFVVSSGPAFGEDYREWKDGSAKFSVKAKLVSNKDGMITLALEGGEEVEIELKKLCEADQKYVLDREKDKDNPFKAAPKSDPFKAKKPAAPRAGSAEARPVNADWSDVRTLVLAPEKGDWEVAVGPSPTFSSPKSRAIGVPPKSGFFEKLRGLVVSSDGKHAAVGYGLDDPRPVGASRIVLIDLESGKSRGSTITSGLMAPVALSDDGAQVLMRRDEFGFGNADRLEVWSLNGQSIVKGIAFFPYNDARGGDRDVKWAAFTGPDRVLTVSGKGKLALWDLASARAIYTLSLQDGASPALSPDRKLLAFTTGKEVGVLDVESGAVQGLRPLANTPFASLAFSPSGKRFAVASIDKLRAFDTATGELQTEMLLTGVAVNGEAQWTDEDHVLVGHQYLLDLANQVRLWQYPGVQRASAVGPITLFAVENGEQSPGALVSAQLPHAAARAALAKAIADPNFFVLKAGVTVRVVVDGVGDSNRRAEVVAALGEKLALVGAKSGPGTLELVASTEVGKQRDITYRTFGRGFGVQAYKVQEYISRVKFVYQGKTAWESSSYNIPHFVSLREGQTMEAYLKEQEKPNYDFFSKVELPKLLTRPTGAVTLGSSTVTTAGIR